MDMDLLVAVGVFVATFVAISLDKVHKTLVALLGAMAMILLGLVSQEEAFRNVDWNVIFLLAGMMVIANTLRRTGVFQWAAMKIIDVARGEPMLVMLLLSTLTAVTSAFLDNVTTVVLMVPITVFVAGALGISPVPLLIAEVLASNIGGAATLIGDPPNIIIGSASGLDFGAFLFNMGPVIVVIYAVFIGLLVLLFRGQLRTTPERVAAAMRMREEGVITDRTLLVQSLLVLAAVIIGFLLHGALGYEAATVAMSGAAVLMLVSRVEVHDMVSEIEWATLLFFFGLFVVVEALVHVGFVEIAARGMLSITGGDPTATTMLMLWGSAVASALIDNIPYTATMVTIVPELARTMPADPLWWALALGACLGGNGTAIGASANVIVLSLAERAGYKISFVQFLGYGVLVTFVSMIISTVYVWVRYLM
ncbi:MAG TPA: ArsB/NhaD family transporter [Chloroflexia bacterium]|nr:ArsB/NhaD family transporter [Chloroflexia bacterium]